jgi:hypothetical protein
MPGSKFKLYLSHMVSDYFEVKVIHSYIKITNHPCLTKFLNFFSILSRRT